MIGWPRLPSRFALGLALALAAALAVVGGSVEGAHAAGETESGQASTLVNHVMELPQAVDDAVVEQLVRLLDDSEERGRVVLVRVTRTVDLAASSPEKLKPVFDRRAHLAVQVVLPQPDGGQAPDLGDAGSLLLAAASHRIVGDAEAKAAFDRVRQKAVEFCPRGVCPATVTGSEQEKRDGRYATAGMELALNSPSSTGGRSPEAAVSVVELPETVDGPVVDYLGRILADAADSRGNVLVQVTRAANFPATPVTPANLGPIFDRRGQLTVQVALSKPPPEGRPPDLGTAGSLLLAAAGHRLATEDEARAAFETVNGKADTLCRQHEVCTNAVSGTGRERDDGRYTVNGNGSLVERLETLPGRDADPESQPIGSMALSALVVLAVGGILLFAMMRSKKRPGKDGEHAETPGRPPTAEKRAWSLTPISPAPGVGTHGVVHSDFHPQGYVAVDGALVRAVWKGSDRHVTRVGDPVRLRADPADGLQALPVDGSDRHSTYSERGRQR